MKTIALLLVLLSLSGLYLFVENNNTVSLKETIPQDLEAFKTFQSWKSQFNQNYNSGEEAYRFVIFKKNLNFINEHNATGDQLVLGLNQFAAMSNTEWQLLYLLQKKQTVGTAIPNSNYKSDNLDFDWAKKGAVLPTKNQGHCGSCWAFSSIGGLEGLRFIVDGVLEPLSAQQLVSCIPSKYLDPGATDGCGGSEPRYAYTYTHEHGIETWANYPYVSGEDGQVPACHHKDEDSVFFNKGDGQDDGYYRIPSGDVPEIKKRLQEQPLSIGVAAGNVFFQFYQKGTIISSDKCGTAIDHSILMTGIHDVEGETPYWIVQNSWGTTWGDNGFGRIAVTEGDGVCGINMTVEQPLSIHQKDGNKISQ